MPQKITSLTYGQAGYWAHVFEMHIQKKNLERLYAQALIAYYADAAVPYLATTQPILKAAMQQPYSAALFQCANNNVHERMAHDAPHNVMAARLACALAVFQENQDGATWALHNFKRQLADNFTVKAPSLWQRLKDEFANNQQNLLGRTLANKNITYHNNAAFDLETDRIAVDCKKSLYYDYPIPLIPNGQGTIEIKHLSPAAKLS